MARSMTRAPRKGKKATKLIVRLLIPMLSLVILQLVIFFGILIAGGEFSYIQQYAYSTLVEKSANRKSYVESNFQQKMPFVHETAEKVNGLVSNLLSRNRVSISTLQENKDFIRDLMEQSVDPLIDLLRRSSVNDAYLILETGDLYNDDGSNAKAALYLRDLDTTTEAGYEDLLMELGLSSISQKFGIILDSGWSLHFKPNPNDTENYDFYYKTLQAGEENGDTPPEYLGYWSGFSKFSNSAAGSMKYTVPLIASDGTVYGVLGIGMTENTILASLPSNDFVNETACYVLGRNQSNGRYDIIAHSGSSFSQLLGYADTLQVTETLGASVYDFDAATDVALAGSVQTMRLYDSASPYASEQWALISVADRMSVLRPLTNLIYMLATAAGISLVIGIVVVILSSVQIVKPITRTIRTMNSSREYGHVVRFNPSHIYEFDKMTEAITQLQINVQDFSSQVSQMMRIADVGLGTFQYDRTDNSVFVGQSTLELLHIQLDRDEDVILDCLDFLESIPEKENRQAITEALNMSPRKLRDKDDYTKEYSVTEEDGSTTWMRLSLIHDNNKIIGVVQDITSAIMEKKRIEYERDYDITTGLLNRRAYYQRLAALFHDKSALKVTAIVMLDLDNLKYVNDTYGHDFGDDYIKTAATALKKFQNYGGIVSRLSGDEFNICLSGFSSKEEVWEIINTVRDQLLQSSCLLADGTYFKIRASAGVAWYPDDAQTYEMLLKYADFAMYTIKHSKKGEIAEFDMSTYSQDSVLLTGVEEVNRIIDERSVRYAFQPIVVAKTGQICGYEALMRPQSSIFQSHLELLRTARTGAKLYELERLTWSKALDDFQSQIDAGNIAPSARVFVNSIATCALDPADMDAIEAAHSGLVSQVVLEVLESENTNENYLERKMNRMRKWKAQIALDDFGISYNSEEVLSSFQPNYIKIDRSIISGCDKDVSRRSIITNLVKLARSRHILVLAGGVETEDELKAVVSCGVDLLQGYFISRPLFEPKPLSADVVDMLQKLKN